MRTPVDDLPPAFAARPAATAGRNATILFLSALTIMAGATIAPALPAIEASFNGSPSAALLTRLILTVPALSIALCAPFAGVFADRYGRKPVAVASVLLYAVAGSSGLYADSLLTLLIGRALLGVAVAGIMTVATALVGDYFTGSARERFMGRQSAFVGVGGLFFLTGGGLLAELHWRAPFLVYMVALALVPALLAFIRDEQPRPASRNLKASGPAGPLITLPLMAILGSAVLNSVVFYLMPTQLPFHLQALGVRAPFMAGIAMGLMTLTSAISSFYYGAMRARLSVPAIFALGFALLGTGLFVVGFAEGFLTVLPGAVVVGIGLGLVMPNLATATMALADENNRGRLAGLLTASIFLGQFISPFASQPLATGGGYAVMFVGGGMALLLAALLALAVAAWQRRSASA